MKNTTLPKFTAITSTLFLLPLCGGVRGELFAQDTPNTMMHLSATAKTATPLFFNSQEDISNSPIPENPIAWGLDVAWDSEANVLRGTNFMTKAVMSTGRISFQPSDLVDADGNLSASQKRYLQSRLDHIALSGSREVALNCDHEKLNADNYYGKPEEWHKVIKATVKYAQSKSFTIVSISPFNEPDYTAWGEGTKAHFKEICRLISEDPELAGIRISAGNTLNCDQALSWYNYMKPYVSEGNTHQLAGSFDNYAKFWSTVRNDGNYATADELHNVMEAFVGIHYGMQSGIWWGFDAAARGEFCKASFFGKEIGYAENRSAWSGATVYKQPNGRVDAFFGTSERQANNSTYELLATDRLQYFDGVGPQYTFTQEMPGGTGYQQGQTNAERWIQIHQGEDVPDEPIKAGSYVIMNRNSKMGIGFYNGAQGNVQITQNTYSGNNSATHMRWIVEPIGVRSGGDFGYFILRSERNQNQVIDVKDWSLTSGGTLLAYPGGLGANEQWFTEYAGEGYWYIRSRHSGLYLEIKNSSTYKNGIVQQAEWTGADNQKWRFMPTNAALEMNAPAAPAGVTVTPQSASMLIQWEANKESDMAGYHILRSSNGNDWEVVGRLIEGTSFIDNDCRFGVTYSYKVLALDRSRNRSAASESVSAQLGERQLVAHYTFDGNSRDTTENLLHAAGINLNYNNLSKKQGESSLILNGTSSFLLLPPAVANMEQTTIAFWANISNYTSSWTRLFDFGNGTSTYMFLCPNNGSEMRLVLKNGGNEQILSAPKATSGWHHYAVAIGAETIALYVDGEKKASTTDITLRPSDLGTVANYIGRSQYASDPLLKGNLDDLRIYNFEANAEEVAKLYQGEEITTDIEKTEMTTPSDYYYNLSGQQVTQPTHGLYISHGHKILIK